MIKPYCFFGFTNKFIKWTCTISNQPIARVEKNQFNIKTGMKQGCRLMAFLFGITVEMLAIHILAKKNINGSNLL